MTGDTQPPITPNPEAAEVFKFKESNPAAVGQYPPHKQLLH